jgi:hypothetical protein
MVAAAYLVFGMAGALALASIARDLARFPSILARLQQQARDCGVHDNER